MSTQLKFPGFAQLIEDAEAETRWRRMAYRSRAGPLIEDCEDFKEADMATETILTPVGIASFLNLKEPRAVVEGSEPRYSLNLIFDKTAQETLEFKKLLEAVTRAAAEKWPSKKPPNLILPFHDGAEKEGQYDGYRAGDVFIIPWTKQKPGVVDRNRQEIVDWSDIWAGWTARAFVRPFAFDNVKRGVGLALDGVQFLRKGKRLDGRANVSEDFPDVPEEETEESDELV
jgi:hypothetical protein